MAASGDHVARPALGVARGTHRRPGGPLGRALDRQVADALLGRDAGDAVVVDDHEAEAAPDVGHRVWRLLEELDEGEVGEHDAGALVHLELHQARAHGLVVRVVHEDVGGAQRGGVQQLLDVLAGAGGGVVTVDEREVDGAALGLERAQYLGEQHVAVTDVKGDVRVVRRIYLRVEVEGVDFLAVGGDAIQRTALGGADLDGELGLDLAQQPLDGQALAVGHLPVRAAHDGAGGSRDLDVEHVLYFIMQE